MPGFFQGLGQLGRSTPQGLVLGGIRNLIKGQPFLQGSAFGPGGIFGGPRNTGWTSSGGEDPGYVAPGGGGGAPAGGANAPTAPAPSNPGPSAVDTTGYTWTGPAGGGMAAGSPLAGPTDAPTNPGGQSSLWGPFGTISNIVGGVRNGIMGEITGSSDAPGRPNTGAMGGPFAGPTPWGAAGVADAASAQNPGATGYVDAHIERVPAGLHGAAQ